MSKVNLEDCCEILDSKRVPITATNRKSGPYPYYGANGIQDYVADYIFDEELVLLAEDGGNFNSTTKPIAYRVSGKCWVNNHAHVLKPRPIIDVDYLCYSLMFYKVGNLVNGATREKLTQAAMRKMQVHLRPMPEQINIVSTLRKAQRIIAHRRTQLAKLDELVKCRFVELFGNRGTANSKNTVLSKVCHFQQGTQIPLEEQFETKKEGYTRFLRIIDYTQAPQPPRYVSVAGKMVTESSVVVVRYGTVGFVGRGFAGILANNLFEVIPNEDLLTKDFLYLALKYGSFEQEMQEKAKGAALKALSFAMMNDVSIALPDKNTQNLFVAFYNRIDKLRISVQAALDKAQTLFDSLMQEYFG